MPKDIATGRNPDGSELKAADKGYPLPPADGSWQTDLRSAIPVGTDGPQWVLEYWRDINNVFQFVRVEDIAYDKRAGKGNIVCIVDSGRGRADGQPAAAVASALNRTTSATGELTRDEILNNITLYWLTNTRSCSPTRFAPRSGRFAR